MSRWWLSRRELPELHHPMVHHSCCGMLHRPEGLRVVRTRGMKHESRQRSAGGDLLHHSVISLRSRWRKQRSAGPRSTHAQVALGLTDTNVGNGSVGYRVRAIGNSTPLACHKVWLSVKRALVGRIACGVPRSCEMGADECECSAYSRPRPGQDHCSSPCRWIYDA